MMFDFLPVSSLTIKERILMWIERLGSKIHQWAWDKRWGKRLHHDKHR